MAAAASMMVGRSDPAVPPNARLHIVALESQFGPIPNFDICNGDYDLTVYDQTPRDSTPVLHERLRDADIAIITTMPMTAATLANEVTPKLRVIMVMAAGTDHLDLEACRRRDIRVLNSPRANTETVAEHAIALYFAIRRKIVQTHQETVKGRWVQQKTLLDTLRNVQGRPPIGLREEKVGIVGYGGVGACGP
jgi:lactate dehydrogenase-like 2-hydroxyacid dehydrogenase